MILDDGLHRNLVLAAMLLAIGVGYLRGREAGPAPRPSRSWTHVPLIALALASVGPSALAVLIWLGYRAGMLQPDPAGYSFSSAIWQLPVDFAAINWPLAAMYLTCRLWPRTSRAAMWTAVAAMALPNLLLFALAPTMLSTVYDAGQGIGVIEAAVTLPLLALLWPGPTPDVIDIAAAFTAPIPVLGLIGWLAGQAAGGSRDRGLHDEKLYRS